MAFSDASIPTTGAATVLAAPSVPGDESIPTTGAASSTIVDVPGTVGVVAIPTATVGLVALAVGAVGVVAVPREV